MGDTPVKPVRDRQIVALQVDAHEARDWAMYDMCASALEGNTEARNLCALAIHRALAQKDGP